MELHIGLDAESTATDAAAFIARKVWPVVKKRGRFHLAVSGGSTPAPMFAALAADAEISWGAVHLYQVDERFAPAGDPARNAGQLDVFPVPTLNRHLMEVEWGDRRLAVSSYAAALPETLDVVHLGLGDDGHTASWPPGDPVVDAKVPVATVGPFNGRERMTITPIVVNAARLRLVLVTGEGKAEMVARWLRGDTGLPISRVKQTNTVVFLDRAAASAIDPAPAG